jgi:hypothetical protein
VLRAVRLAVDVDAEEAEVHRVARVLEIVVVAAELRELGLRGKGEPHVGEVAELAEVVLAALVRVIMSQRKCILGTLLEPATRLRGGLPGVGPA